ncbi:MAG: ATP-dependent DNA ligase [Nanoarchaeota archaeon]|nr:ATP-dependent DNA ligase [Nanoarchaeota archaeon]MBU1269633.1 ATP-dependent DNA ligase [Nanoarchaeota archaeon]MBU1603715.1 ATP-dependent DNA ligase [Nanoarchaeota archaeon]MBU2442739.1 ATP-dependent DNA ligase [Nanoarchaeota archaeon]
MKYSSLVEVYEKIESTSKRLEKTYHISNLLKKTPDEDLQTIILLIRGRLYPDWDKRKIGVASKLVLKAINASSGAGINKIEQLWREIGDLGLVADRVIKTKSQSTLFSAKLTVAKVFSNLRRLNDMEGAGSVDRKVQLISELLSSADEKEAKYIVRTVLEDLRVGIGDGTLRDAIVWAYLPIDVKYNPENVSIDVDREKYNEIVNIVQSAYDKSNDFSTVAIAARKGVSELKKVGLIPGKPVKVMLAQKVLSVDGGFEKVGVPAELEYKYDGFRMQIHKSEGKITIFTRRLEEVTKQFPEVVKCINEHVKGESFIIDCEAVGYDSKTGKYLVFQHVSQRIKRKHNIQELAAKLPVELNIFDILYYNGEVLLDVPFEERRKLLEKIVSEKQSEIILAKKLVTSDKKVALKFYEESVEKGNEGIMLKSLKSVYKPGSRVGFMVKLKSQMDTLDLVIVGAEWGEGKRSGWLTSFSLACIDEDGNYLETGKVGTGVKEKEEEGLSFGELTKMLEPHIKQESGRAVVIKPEIVLEIKFEEIQKSPTYSSGYALRFPRVIQVREDRAPEECSTIEMVKEAFNNQKKT